MSKVAEQIERCIELYGNPLDDKLDEPVSREAHEQMRADLLLVVGMLIALSAPAQPPSPPHSRTPL